MNLPSTVVRCSAYRQGHKLQDMSLDDISDVLAEKDTFVWVGFVEPDKAMLAKIQEEFALHELAIEDARKAHQRPKLEEYGDTLFIVLHTASLEESALRFGETHIFVGAHFIVTIRRGASSSYNGVRQHCENSPERMAKGPGYVLYALLDYIVDQYQPCMEALHARFRAIEDDLFNPKSEDNKLESLYSLKNELLSLQAAVVPVVEICNQLLRFHSDIIPKEIRIYYRDVLDHVERLTRDADRMREMINAAMQVALAQVSIRQNEVVKKLASWGAIYAVPTMIFSLYGMNFNFMPELSWKWSYPVVLAGMTLGCAGLYRRFKRIGWL